MWPFSKSGDKKKKADSADAGEDLSIESAPSEEQKSGTSFGGNIDIELTKIKSSLEAFSEVRKANSERFQRLSEQIGELRGMIMDTNKTIGTVEVSATKAIDLVNAVQPDKLMIDVRKIDGKVEGLRAMIEANEAMMKDIMEEMKGMRKQMNFYKGTEQVMKMNDDVKKEIAEIKHTESVIDRHSNKVETIFLEVEKKFSEFDKFNDVTKDLDKSFKKVSADFDKMKVQIDEKAEKKEFVKVIGQFNDFEKHTGNILKLLDSKSRTVEEDLGEKFKKLATSLDQGFDRVKKEVEKKQQVVLSDVKIDAAQIAAGPIGAPGAAPAKKEGFSIKGIFKKGEKKDDSFDIKKELANSGLGGHDDKPIEQASPADKKIVPGAGANASTSAAAPAAASAGGTASGTPPATPPA